MVSLVEISKDIRRKTLECISAFGSGHIGGSLSIVDVLTVLYFHEMKIDENESKKDDRDRLVVSKGHAGPAVYATLAQKGFIPVSELKTLNQIGTNLPSHCDMNKVNGVDMTTGSLGQGISCALGMALAAKIRKTPEYIYVIIGDGESQEGQVWEAAMFASHKKLDNLILFLDKNNLQLDGYTKDVADKKNITSNIKLLERMMLGSQWSGKFSNEMGPHYAKALGSMLKKLRPLKQGAGLAGILGLGLLGHGAYKLAQDA